MRVSFKVSDVSLEVSTPDNGTVDVAASRILQPAITNAGNTTKALTQAIVKTVPAIEDWGVASFCVICALTVTVPSINKQAEKFFPTFSLPQKIVAKKIADNTVTMDLIIKDAIASAARGDHYKEGVEAQCANWIRYLFANRGVNLPVTQSPVDGVMPTGLQVANGLAGTDMGEIIKNIKDLRPGDLVFFQNTYGNWPAGTITHVGITTKILNETPYMAHRSTSSRPIREEPVWKFSFHSGLRLKPELLKKSIPETKSI